MPHSHCRATATTQDGHFVPNLTLGPPIIKSLRDATPLYLDCHFMVSNPAQWVAPAAKAGANMYTFHLEAVEGYNTGGTGAAKALCHAVREAGMHCGIAIKPATPAELLLPYIDAGLVDMVLVMTVEPGFGGQAFMPEMMDKVRTLRQHSPRLNVQVDGGLAPSTIQQAAEAGANVIVAGSAVFGVPDRAQAVATLAKAVDDAAGR